VLVLAVDLFLLWRAARSTDSVAHIITASRDAASFLSLRTLAADARA
jgi:hypothetical protein